MHFFRNSPGGGIWWSRKREWISLGSNLAPSLTAWPKKLHPASLCLTFFVYKLRIWALVSQSTCEDRWDEECQKLCTTLTHRKYYLRVCCAHDPLGSQECLSLKLPVRSWRPTEIQVSSSFKVSFPETLLNYSFLLTFPFLTGISQSVWCKLYFLISLCFAC